MVIYLVRDDKVSGERDDSPPLDEVLQLVVVHLAKEAAHTKQRGEGTGLAAVSAPCRFEKLSVTPGHIGNHQDFGGLTGFHSKETMRTPS